MGHKSHGTGAGLRRDHRPSGRLPPARLLRFFEGSSHPARRRTDRAIWRASRTELPMGKNCLGGLGEKIFSGAAPGLIPTGAASLNSLAPAVFEAAERYMKSPSASLLQFGL